MLYQNKCVDTFTWYRIETKFLYHPNIERNVSIFTEIFTKKKKKKLSIFTKTKD